ncbi:MAG: MFS transporter [Candidatus Aceula lacicola]|nr:MFS transporter [Candidatus Aceula lacicola]
MRKRQAINIRKIVYGLLCLNCITISFNVAAIAAAVPGIAANLHLPDFLVSRIIPAYMIPYGIGALLYAPLARYFSFRLVMAASIGLYALGSLLCAQITSIDHFVIARILCGVAGAGVIPLGLIIIGKMFEKKVRGRLVGLFFGCSFVSSVAGVFLSGVADWRYLFYIPFVLGLLASFLIFIVKSDILEGRQKNPINYFNIIYNIKIRNIFIFIFIISFLYHGLHKWFGVYLNHDYGLNQLSISLIFVLMAVFGFAGQILGGFISDKRGRLMSCFVGILILGASTMLLVGHYPVWILAIILCATSIGWTIGHNGVSTVLTDFPEENRAEVASLNSSVRFLSGGLGFLATAPFVEKSFSVTFLCIGALMFLLILFVRKAVCEH